MTQSLLFGKWSSPTGHAIHATIKTFQGVHDEHTFRPHPSAFWAKGLASARLSDQIRRRCNMNKTPYKKTKKLENKITLNMGVWSFDFWPSHFWHPLVFIKGFRSRNVLTLLVSFCASGLPGRYLPSNQHCFSFSQSDFPARRARSVRTDPAPSAAR